MRQEVLGFEWEENLSGRLRGRLGVAAAVALVVRLGGCRGARERGGLIGVVPAICPDWFRVLHNVDSKPESREARSEFQTVREKLIALKPEAVDFRSDYAQAQAGGQEEFHPPVFDARQED